MNLARISCGYINFIIIIIIMIKTVAILWFENPNEDALLSESS